VGYELPIIKEGNVSMADLDIETYKKENKLKLDTEPVLITKENTKLVLVFKGNKIATKPKTFLDRL
jgi:hypothetical protein